MGLTPLASKVLPKTRTELLARADTIHLLYRQSAPAIAFTILSTLFISAILWQDADPRLLLGWAGLVHAMIAWRGFIFYRYFRRKPQGLDRLQWERPFVLALFASAAVWSVGLTSVAVHLSLEGRLFAYFFLMGMAAGAISVFIALRYAAIITVSIMLAPMTLVFLSSGRTPEMITAIAACVVIVSTISGTKTHRNSLVKIFMLTYELADKAQKLEKARLVAEHAKNTRGQFVASVSHEIRTPLSVILGMIEMIRAEPLSPLGARYVRTLETAGAHLKSLVDNVLDFVKIDENQMDLQEQSADLVDIAQKITEVFAEAATRKGIRLVLDHRGLSQPHWVVDQQRLQQILINVVGNALNYSESGVVTIKLRDCKRQSGVAIVVADQGLGIPKDKLEQIFEPYIQGQDRRLDEVPSTGLGLAITKKLVELMGGKIKVRSRLGVGSVFQITLPLVPARSGVADHQGAPVKKVSYSDLRGKSLLVAEDIPLARDLIKDFVHGTGMVTVFVGFGVEALERVKTTPFDLILLDLQMAPKGGIETTKDIRRYEAETGFTRCPIIIQSADNRIESVDASLAAGADHFLPKPFSRNQLLGALTQVLQGNDRRSERAAPPLDPALVRLLPRFVSETAAALETVRLALDAGDFSTAAEELHKIKGNCGMFQCLDLYHQADEWEQTCRTENLEAAREQHAQFLADFQKVRAAL